MSQPRSPSARGFTLVELLIVIAIIGLLVSLSIPAIQASREAARRAQCTSNQRQFGVAFSNAESKDHVFPAGISMRITGPLLSSPDIQAYSFIVDLLPFLEEAGIAAQYHRDAFFCAPENSAAIRSVINVAICPSTPEREGVTSNRFIVSQWASSSFVRQFGAPVVAALEAKYSRTYDGAVTDYTVPLRADNRLAQSLGYQTPNRSPNELRSTFPLPDTNKLVQRLLSILKTTGSVEVGERTRAAQITDGLSKTFLLAEDAGRPLHWIKGVRTDLHEPLISAWSDPMNGLVIRDPADKQGTCLINCDNEANIYSFHPNGANILFADGHVTFLGDDTDPKVLLALMTPDRGDN